MTIASFVETAPETVHKPTRESSRVQFNKAMKTIRRVHLYAGLFMTPWVFLYGVTALLFNHPTLFSDQEIRSFGPEMLEGTILADLPQPARISERVVAALNAEAEGAARYELARPEEATFARELTGSARSKDKEHTVRINLESGAGSVRTGQIPETRGGPTPAPIAPRTDEAPTGKPVGGREGAGRRGGGEGGGRTDQGRARATGAAPAFLKLDPPPIGPLEPAIARIIERIGVTGAETPIVRVVPDLTFVALKDGAEVRVSYNTRTGAVSERAASGGSSRTVSTRRFLLQLHTAHGYPSTPNARWVWALAVDVMALSMVGWGVTGLLMWWQMKNVRAVGAVVLVLSAIVALATAIGMHRAITA